MFPAATDERRAWELRFGRAAEDPSIAILEVEATSSSTEAPDASLFEIAGSPAALSVAELTDRIGYRPAMPAFTGALELAAAIEPSPGPQLPRSMLVYTDGLDYLRTATTHFGNMTAICEETSLAENRIALGAHHQDAYGLPAAQVVNNLPQENTARLELAKTEGLKIFRAAGASEVWASGRNAVHLMGGTLMGDDPDRSVTNSYGQTHEVDNLFVVGASLFPTAAAVNPTATLASLALRTTAYIREHRGAFMP